MNPLEIFFFRYFLNYLLYEVRFHSFLYVKNSPLFFFFFWYFTTSTYDNTTTFLYIFAHTYWQKKNKLLLRTVQAKKKK